MKNFDFMIIGAGAAGIAAAKQIANKLPQASCAVVERDSRPGGILLQCIHPGFGVQYFKEELTGPEYAEKAFSEIENLKIELFFNTTVTAINKDRTIDCSNQIGFFQLSFSKLILATGSREVPLSSLAIPSMRPSGVFGAGEAQLLINRYAFKPGSVGVIIGAGDIGLIMARRLVYEGMKVSSVIEIQNEPGGVRRNVQTCIYDLNISLRTNSTLVQIHGKERVTGVTVAKVDQKFSPDFSAQEYIPCDFVLSAIGLMPEIALAKDAGADFSNGHLSIAPTGRSSIPWLFACGNAAKIFPIVDEVSYSTEKTIDCVAKADCNE